MPNVTNIKVRKQTGSDKTLLATWDFRQYTTTSVTSAIKVGSLVSIVGSATYYNGVSIPDWVKNQRWYVSELIGDRAVLGRNESGTNNITSPVNVKYLKAPGSVASVEVTDKLDHFTVQWYYDTGDGVWFTNGTSDTYEKYSTFNYPSNAKFVYVNITPYSKTHEVNGVDTSYWTPSTTGSSIYNIDIVGSPEKPAKPTVEVNRYNITGYIDNISDHLTDEIDFYIYSGERVVRIITAKVINCKASFTYAVGAGKFNIRCKAISLYNGVRRQQSEWSDFVYDIETAPTPPVQLACKADSKTSEGVVVRLEWKATSSTTGTTYDIEYTENKSYFDTSDSTTIKSDIKSSPYLIPGLETGKEWFFRVRSSNSSGEKSQWGKPVSIVLGDPPAVPTTWSSTTVAVTGEPMNLYWVHNSADGSSQTYAILEIALVKDDGLSDELYQEAIKSLTDDGFALDTDGTLTKTIKNTTDETEKDKTSVYSIDTSKFTEGIQIRWRVKTKGVVDEYGEFSTPRTVYIYAPPTLQLNVTDLDGNDIDTLTSFPLRISALAGPETQIPTGYHLSISAKEGYTSIDYMGNKKIVIPGEIIYSKFFDVKEPLMIDLSASDVDLENGINYLITCSVSMNSGLTAEDSRNIAVSWSDVEYDIDAEIAIDKKSIVAYINPYCMNNTGEIVTSDILLSVYRREYDGSFTEIAKNIDNYLGMTVTDPHPALNYARYRIVAMDKATGAISYYDPPGYPVMETSIIIQWNEDWTNFDVSNKDEYNPPPWTGSFLKLPYNIDVSDNFKSDVELVNYIGRTYPVGYYGTHLDLTSTWNVEIPKDDTETLYAIRRLSTWLGNVYVREPSGSGYWASIDVSYSQKHCGLTIPITLNVTRVEGGV